MYNLALEANPRMEETPARMRNLAHVHLPKNRLSAGEELSRMRSLELPKITKETANADFYVVLAAGKIEKANFLKGSDLLHDATDSLKKARFEEPVPPNSTMRLLRKGILSCSSYTGCSFVFYPLSVVARTPVPSSDNLQAGQVQRQCGFSTPETQLKAFPGKVSQGKLIHRVEPEYPPAARQAYIQGTVVLCGTIAKDGTLRNLRASSGPEELIPSAMKAVEQWRYEPYLLDNEPVDVNSEIQVNFSLSH
jgi:TonB family protein